MPANQPTPKQIVDAFWKSFAGRELGETFRQHMTSECEFVMPGAPAMRGQAAIVGMFEAYVRAFPDFECETLHAIESGDTYAAETRFAGTHEGPLVMPQGTIPATRRRIGWQSADVVRV